MDISIQVRLPDIKVTWADAYTEDMGSGYFRIKSRFSNLCVDVNAASTTDGASIIQWACGSGNNQQWKNP